MPMTYFVDVLNILSPVLYALAVANSIAHFVTQSEFARRADRPLLLATVGAHALLLALKSVQLGRCPMGGVFEAMGLMAFSLATVYLFLSIRTGTRPTGILVLPIAFMLQVFSAAAPTPEPAACTSTSSPGRTAARTTSMCHAVRNVSGTAAASGKDSRAGFGRQQAAGTTACSAQPPSVVPFEEATDAVGRRAERLGPRQRDGDELVAAAVDPLVLRAQAGVVAERHLCPRE